MRSSALASNELSDNAEGSQYPDQHSEGLILPQKVLVLCLFQHSYTFIVYVQIQSGNVTSTVRCPYWTVKMDCEIKQHLDRNLRITIKCGQRHFVDCKSCFFISSKAQSPLCSPLSEVK